MFVGPGTSGALDWGPVWAGYLGCVLFSSAAVAVGMMLSSLTESDVIAFFMTSATLSILYAIGWMAAIIRARWVTPSVSLVSDSLSIVRARPHRYSRRPLFPIGRTVCILVSFRSLESRKWS